MADETETTDPTPGASRQVSDGLVARSSVGAAWTIGALLVAEPIRVVSIAVLARLLSPTEFGLVGMAAIFIGVVAIGNDLGFTVSLIRAPDLTREQTTAVFWINLAAGVAFLVVGVMAAPLVAGLFGEPRAERLIVVLSLNFLLTSLFLVQNALTRRAMDFRTPALANIAGVSASAVVGVLSVLLGQGAMSLVFGSLAGTLVSGLTVQNAVRYVPGRPRELRLARPFVSMGAALTLGEFANYGAGNADNAVTGRLLGSAALGAYAVAFNLVTYPVRKIVRLLAAVALPALSSIQEDGPRFREAYVRMLGLVACLALPVLSSVAVVGDRLVLGIYGAKWAAAVAPFRILCFAAMLSVPAVLGELVLKSLGHARAYATLSAVGFAAVLAMSIAGSTRGISGVAVGVLLSTAVYAILVQHRVNRSQDLTFRRVGARFGPALVLSALVALAAAAARWAVAPLHLPAFPAALAVMVSSLTIVWLTARRVGWFADVAALEGLAGGLVRTGRPRSAERDEH